jgi:UPF0755 protein
MPLSWRGGKSRIALAVTGLVAVALAWLGVRALDAYNFLYRVPYQAYLSAQASVTLDPGSRTDQAASRLEAAGVVSSARFFVYYLRWQGWDQRVQAGTYRFSRPMTLPEVARAIVTGRIARKRVTLPEGWTASRMFRELEAEGFGRHAAYMRLWADTRLVADFAPEAESLEGYLFPDTYEFPEGLGETDVVAALVRRFRKVVLPLLGAGSGPRRLSRHQLVTLASLVEREAAVPDERPLVASVFANRLDRSMRLQCDPTLIYAEWLAKGDWDGEINRSDLARPSPYNTYRHAGLPPGPIASPGRGAVAAVLEPAATGYLYFVSMNNGRHVFSDNLRAHNQAVRKYQRRAP